MYICLCFPFCTALSIGTSPLSLSYQKSLLCGRPLFFSLSLSLVSLFFLHAIVNLHVSQAFLVKPHLTNPYKKNKNEKEGVRKVSGYRGPLHLNVEYNQNKIVNSAWGVI